MTAPGLAVLGVPTSAGSHHAGQDRAPAALRSAGFVDRLRAGGLDVVDRGDVAGEVFAVDHAHPEHRNLDVVVRVATQVASATAAEVAAGRVAVVLGGDCTITLGVMAGVQRAVPSAGLLYFDGDADLSTPGRGSGILDAMGIAHLLGHADTPLARLGGPAPMLRDDRLVMLGFDPGDPDSFDATLLGTHPALERFSDAEVRAAPADVARRAVEAVSASSEAVVLHFDVDAVDSGDLPLANFPHYGTGVSLDVATTVLAALAAAPDLAAVVLTEVNPSYDPSGEALDRYVSAVTSALVTGLARHR
jgi:arginase